METSVINHEVKVLRKFSDSEFVKANREHFPEGQGKIGSSTSGRGIHKGISFDEELAYMPFVLNINPTVIDFQKLVNNYFNAITKTVPQGGLKLQIGFRYSLDIAAKSEFGKSIVADNGIKTDAELAKFIDEECAKLKPVTFEAIGKVREDQKYLFGNPLELEDYILWRYLLGYKNCARTHDLVYKSPRIKFYLKDGKVIKRDKESLYLINKRARKAFDTICQSKERTINLLVANSMYDSTFSDMDCEMKLSEFMTQDPNGFIKLASDKDLNLRADVERMIHFNILNRSTNSTVIYDHKGGTIGVDMDATIAWFKDERVAPEANKLRSELAANVTKYSPVKEEE